MGPFGDLESSSSSPSAGGRRRGARHPPRQRLGRFRRASPFRCARFGSHHRILILIPWLSGAPSSLSPDPFAKATVHGRNARARRMPGFISRAGDPDLNSEAPTTRDEREHPRGHAPVLPKLTSRTTGNACQQDLATELYLVSSSHHSAIWRCVCSLLLLAHLETKRMSSKFVCPEPFVFFSRSW